MVIFYINGLREKHHILLPLRERERACFTATRERIQRDRIDPNQAELFPNNYFKLFSMER